MIGLNHRGNVASIVCGNDSWGRLQNDLGCAPARRLAVGGSLEGDRPQIVAKRFSGRFVRRSKTLPSFVAPRSAEIRHRGPLEIDVPEGVENGMGQITFGCIQASA